MASTDRCVCCAPGEQHSCLRWYPIHRSISFFSTQTPFWYGIPAGVNGVVLANISLSVHRNLISAPGAFGDDFTEDSRQLKGFRFLSKSGITHPNWDLWAEKWRRLKKTRMLPRVRCVPCTSLSLKSHFYATTLSFIPFVLLRLACEVRLETMAALDGKPYPQHGACGYCLLGGGAGVIDLPMFCGFGITCTYGERRQCLCCTDKEKHDGDEMTAGVSSCHRHPVERLCFWLFPCVHSVSSHTNWNPRGLLRSPDPSSRNRASKTLYLFHQQRSAENRKFNHTHRIHPCTMHLT